MTKHAEIKERFKNFFLNSIVGKSITSIDGKLDVNEAFCNIVGYTENELNKLNWRDITFKDDIELNEKYIKSILAGEIKSMRWEKRYIHKDGHIVWVDINTNLERDADGNPLYFITELIDISEKKKAEYKTQLNAKRSNALVDLLQYSTDSIHDYLDYALTKIIEITESKIGYIYHYYEDRQEFVLNTWSKEVMNECKVQDQQTVYQLEKTGLWGEAVRQRKAILVNDFQAPHPLKKGQPEGHAPLYRYLTIPVFSKNEIVGVVAVANKDTDYVDEDIVQLTIMMDIVWKSIEKKKADINLIESEKKYRLLLENSGVGISVFDLDSKIIMLNQMALQNIGGKKEDYIGKSIFEIYGEEAGRIYSDRINATIQSDLSLEFEDKLDSSSGQKWFQSNFSKIKNANDNVIGVQIIAQDISNRKKAEEALIKKNKDLDYMNKFMVNRELRMAEMKREVNELLERLGEEKRYL